MSPPNLNPGVVFLISALGVLLLVQSVRLYFARRSSARRMNRNRKLGQASEKRARHLLEEKGFSVIETQTMGGYELLVDEEKCTVALRADFIVKRGKRVYLAEVKGGLLSARPTLRSTRRQLLEYTYAFDVDGLLLVDVPGRRIVSVRFPQ